MKMVRIALVGLLASCLFVGTGESAHAVTYTWEGIDYGSQNNAFNPGFHRGVHCLGINDRAGDGCYYGDDDDFRVFDNAPDGRRVGVEWKTDYGRWGMCVSRLGNSLKGERKCYRDFKEGHRIIMRVMLCDADAFTCGKPVRGSGWFGEDGGPAPTAWSGFST